MEANKKMLCTDLFFIRCLSWGRFVSTKSSPELGGSSDACLGTGVWPPVLVKYQLYFREEAGS